MSQATNQVTNPLLSIERVSVRFSVKGGLFAPRRQLRAVENVSLGIGQGETLALVGESGSGKSTLGYVVAGLRSPTEGRVLFEGEPLNVGGARGRRPIQIVFQDPFSALDPRMMAGDIIAEPLRIAGVGKEERRERAAGIIELVDLPPDSMERYPHQFSGGQRQRVAIARALVAEPALIVADEPLSALDVSIQSQILNVMHDIKVQRRLGFLFISHDLAVVNHLADRVAVLYLGRLMEVADRRDLFDRPSHPYTQALLDAVPRVGTGRRQIGRSLMGEIPTPLSPPSGCVFHTRCPKAQAMCREIVPELLPAPGRPRQMSACHFKD